MLNSHLPLYNTFDVPVEAEALTVQLVAPSTMPAGYQFLAVFEGISFTVEVPEGGVKKGEYFTVPLSPDRIAHTTTVNRSRGQWRDGLCDCFRLGLCHPSVLNAAFCPLIILGQIMTRMKLNWLGQSVEQSEWERTFRTLIYILIAFIVFNLLFGPPPPVTTPDGNVTIMETRPSIIVTLFNIINLAFASFCLLLTCRVRGFIRYNYDIPEAQCLGCEDICCSFWCGCCTLAQMARQTVDYDLEQATCCTNDGLFPLQNRGAVTI